MKVRITSKTHPHYGETGELTGTSIKPFNKVLFEVKLDDCPHGTESCYISDDQAVEIRPKINDHPAK